MVFTPDALWVVTTVKKGTRSQLSSFGHDLMPCYPAAKHLEGLKGGKTPLEILIRGKDPEQNAKHFEKCLDLIKTSGVRRLPPKIPPGGLMNPAEESRCSSQGHNFRSLHRGMEEGLRGYHKRCRRGGCHTSTFHRCFGRQGRDRTRMSGNELRPFSFG